MRNGLSLAQLLLNLSMIVLLLGLALLSLVLGLAVLQEASVVAAGGQVLIAAAANLTVLALLLLPGAWYGLQGWLGKPLPAPAAASPLQRSLPSLLFFGLLPLVLLAGLWLNQNSDLALFLLPLLNILAVFIPVYWLLSLVLQTLAGRSPQRTWGLLGSGLVLGPAVILMIEILLLVAGVIAIAVAAGANPGLANEIESLATRIQFAAASPSTLNRILQPYLAQPWVIISILGFVALLVPLIEETFKPVGLWLLAGRRLTAAEGFVAGALSGAGFAIFESLFMNINAGFDQWAATALVRIGTAAMHIFASALCGWGLASAWHAGSYKRLAAGFGAAVLLHGVWNAAALSSVILSWQSPALPDSVQAAPLIILALLASGSVLGLVVFSRRLQPAPAPSLLFSEPQEISTSATVISDTPAEPENTEIL